MDQGVIFYDKYNNQDYREAAFIHFLENFQFDPDIPIYSNIPAAVYFYTNKDSQPSPGDPYNYYASRETLASLDLEWPKEEEAYFIWFESNDRRFYFSPRDLRTIAPVKKLDIFDGEGGLYFVTQEW